jgi:penicillin-binding protein 2
MIIKQLHSRLPGVRAEPASVRQYRQGDLNALAHILGYVGEIHQDQYATDHRLYPRERFGPTDQVGETGIELALDPYLHGVNDNEQVMVDAGERPIRVLRHGRTVPGDAVYLTIDWSLQQQVAQDLGAGLQKLGLRRGVAVVEDVHSGRILAMASLPSYNNNWFAGAISTTQYEQLIRDPAVPLDDMATAGLFPPGSTYKLVTATAGLESHVIDANTTYDDTGAIKLCSIYVPSSCQTYLGWNPLGLGSVNVVLALAKSSDIFFYTVGGGNPNLNPQPPYVGADRLAVYARLLGLGSRSGIEVPGEAAGLVPSKTWFDRLKVGPLRAPGTAWHIGDTYNMAIGQGFDESTPLQMANIVATIANGGTLYRTRIVERVQGQVSPKHGVLSRGQVIQPFVPSIVRRNFLQPETLGLIQQGMHESVSLPGFLGTSFAVRDRRIDAAGKTGTAEAFNAKGLPSPHSWWIGYAPFRHPKIAVAVIIPNADTEGAYGAAPIAHKIFEDYFHLKPTKVNWLDDVIPHDLVGSGRAG